MAFEFVRFEGYETNTEFVIAPHAVCSLSFIREDATEIGLESGAAFGVKGALSEVCRKLTIEAREQAL